MNGTYNATTVSRSGAVCNYVANVGGVPLSRFIANITPVQAGSGDPSPSNIRPITGWSAVNVNDYQGKNLFNKDGTQTTPFFFGQGNSTFNQNLSATTVTVYAPCKPNTKYTVSKTAGKRFIVGYGDTIPIKGYPVRNAVSNGTASSITITTDSTAKFLYAFIWNSNYDTISSADMIASTQIEENSEATAYAPFVGQTATINLGGTYYVGTLNVLTGLMTITAKYLVFNSAGYYGTYGYDDAPLFYVSIAGEDIKKMTNVTENGILISNMLTKITGINYRGLGNYEMRTDTSNQRTRLYFRIDDCTSQADIDTFFSDKTLQVVAELETPVEYQLTPAQVTQLLGENNVWCDSGDSEVDFFKIIRT